MASKSSTKVISNGGGSYVVSSAAATVFVTPGQLTTVDTGKLVEVPVPNVKNGKSVRIMQWGNNNDQPQKREELVMGNNIVPTLIQRQRDIIAGQGWYAYRRTFVDGKEKREEVPLTPAQEVFFNGFRKVSSALLGDLLKHALAIPEFIRNREGQIISLKAQEAKYVRAGKKEDGEIRRWYWSNNWVKDGNKTLDTQDARILEMPVYNPEVKQPKFVYPLMDDLFNDGYYPIPAYWGGRLWISLSNIIPQFHEANLLNGAAPRFNVVIPHDYFYDYAQLTEAESDNNAERTKELLKGFQAAERAFVTKLEKVLSGVANAGKMVVTKSQLLEALGGKESRIQIEEIKYDLRDEALLKLYAASNIANVSAQGLHPVLASIDTGKGIGSGTEIRNAFLLHLIIAAPGYRAMLEELVDLIKTENKWDADVHFAIRDAEMTTLADNPSGIQPAETPIGA